jgi:NADPH:quinone reductase-like Zn-dependent oxidoreductase
MIGASLFSIVRAAVLESYGVPQAAEFREPQPGPGTVVLEMEAAAVNHVDLLKAAGGFYTGPPPLPSVVGSDGVGQGAGGQRFYFDAPVAPFGSMAQRALVEQASLIPVCDGLDPLIAAALGNAGLAAHTGLHWRGGLKPGETVVVLGATGVVGRLAVQVARLARAGRIIAAGRDPAGLAQTVELGAHETVQIGVVEDLEGALAGADLIFDLLWGAPALAALARAAPGVRLIQIGQLAAVHAPLAAPLLRSRAADIRGHAVFHAPAEIRAQAYQQLAHAVLDGELEISVRPVALGDIAAAWARQAAGTHGVKQVIVP